MFAVFMFTIIAIYISTCLIVVLQRLAYFNAMTLEVECVYTLQKCVRLCYYLIYNTSIIVE